MSVDAQEVARGPSESAPSDFRRVSIAERRRLVAESLRIGNPGNNARDLPADADPRHECRIELRVVDIRTYEHNPRRAGNAKFAEIKESIRAAGIRNPLTVTRRPGDSHFIVESGGNTRLLAVQQLWAETGDPRFEKLTVLFRPWRSESHVLTAHIVENELRGEMTFYDRAAGIVAIKAHLEAEKRSALSLRQLEAALKALGLATNPTTLSQYLFVAQHLRVLAESIRDLSAQDIKTIQPRLNSLKRHAQARAEISEATLYESVFDPVIREVAERCLQGDRFSPTEVCAACELALARHLGEPVAELRLDLGAMSRSGQGVRPEITATPVPPTTEVPALSADGGSEPRKHRAVSGADSRGVRASPRAAADMLPSVADHRRGRTAITEDAQRLARLAGIDAQLRCDPTASLGFWMTEQPVLADDLRPQARRVWWLLSRLADPQAPSRGARIPSVASEGSSSTMLAEPEATASDAAENDARALLSWLVDPDDALAGATLQFLDRLRTWHMGQRPNASVTGGRPESKEQV